MKVNDIFEMEHSNNINLIPLKNLQNDNFEELIKKFDLDINDFYIVKHKLYPYCYSKGTVFVQIYEMSESYFINFHVKDMIVQILKVHDECIKTNNYNSLFVLIDKPFRINFFKLLFDKIPDNQKYEIFKSIYTSSEYGFENLTKELLDKVFKCKTKEKWFKEDVITIYRGEGSLSKYYKEAYSWTTDINVAKFFATRFDSVGDIYRGKVKQTHILDYIVDRKESEILVYPEYVFDVELIT